MRFIRHFPIWWLAKTKLDNSISCSVSWPFPNQLLQSINWHGKVMFWLHKFLFINLFCVCVLAFSMKSFARQRASEKYSKNLFQLGENTSISRFVKFDQKVWMNACWTRQNYNSTEIQTHTLVKCIATHAAFDSSNNAVCGFRNRNIWLAFIHLLKWVHFRGLKGILWCIQVNYWNCIHSKRISLANQ